MTSPRTGDAVRVLVVDDDPDFADLTAAFLRDEDASFEVETATGAEDGLSLFVGGDFDCVVSDYEMPKMDGLTLFEEMRAVDPTVPFILFTGKGSEEIASRAISTGVTDYLQKQLGPEQFERLANRIRHATDARRTQRAVEGVRAHLQTVVDSATDVILTADEEGTIQFVNESVEDVFGYAPEELVGEPVTALVPERLRGRHTDAFERYVETGERRLDWSVVEFPGLHRDGHEVPLSMSYGEFTRDGERYLTGVLRDITERQDRERALSLYETVVEALDEAVWMVDGEGSVTFVNRHVAGQFGSDRESILGRHVTDVLVTEEALPADVVDEFEEGLTAVLAGERPSLRVEIALPRTGGHVVRDVRVVPVEEGGEVVGAVGLNRDVTEQARLQSELEEMLGRIPDAFVSLDEQWRITYVNDRTVDLLDSSRADLLDEEVWDVFEEPTVETFREQYRRAMETREPVFFEEYYPPLETWFAVRAYPSEAGLSVYLRDVTSRKHREQRLAGLNETLAECLLVDERQRLCNVAVESANERLDLPVTAIALFDDDDGTLRIAARTPQAQRYLDDETLLERGAELAWESFTAGERVVLEEFGEAVDDEAASGEHLLVYPLGRHGVFITVVEAPGGLSTTTEDFVETVVGNLKGALDRIERTDVLRERERRLAEQNEWLDRLNRINGVIRRIHRALVDASTRTEVERTVCEELVAEGPYRFAWVGQYDPHADRIEPRAYDGDEQGYLDVVRAGQEGDVDEDRVCPTLRAARTHEPAWASDVLTEPPLAAWQKAALDRGFRSCMAIPLVYHERLYGVLTVYADRPDVFDELERDVLVELGAIIAHTVNAIERSRAFVNDEVVELEFEVDPREIPLLEPFVGVDGCVFDLDSVVSSVDGSYRVFFTLENPPDDVVSRAESSPVIRECSRVTERDGVGVYECTVTGESVVSRLYEQGAVPRSIGSDGYTHLTVELSREADVRDFVESFQGTYPGAELVARREHERSGKPRQVFRSELTEQLTPRQQEVLRTAYFSGFFDTPREHTGREVASIVGISQPTFSEHLRAATRKLLDMLYRNELDEADWREV